MRFCARAFSVTCPLTLDLVLVLELRANDALERRRLERKKTRSRRRNVIGITATWIPGKFFVALLSADQPMHRRPETLRVKSKATNAEIRTSLAMVRESLHRVQLSILLVLK
jgi:hypothetical protein